jgi:hypothetical protein
MVEESSQALYGALIRAINDGPLPFAHPSVLGAFEHTADARDPVSPHVGDLSSGREGCGCLADPVTLVTLGSAD